MFKTLKVVALTAVLAAGVVVAPASASTITDAFSFENASNVVVASGSFSYDSSKSGTLSYADLNSFQITLFGAPFGQPDQSYNLSFVQTLNPATNYVWFAYNTVSNSFVAGAPLGFPSVLAGTNLSAGFFFDDSSDYQFAGYSPVTTGCFGNCPTYASVAINETPLPSTWTMLIAGFVGLGFFVHRGLRTSSAVVAAV